jgi:hypothetical protein
MKLMGFNFTKLNIEKKSSKFEELKIDTSINLDSIEETKQEIVKSKDSFLSIKFNYLINYNPDIAKISLNGNILLAVDEKMCKEILNDWKDKKLKDNFRLSLFNFILRKSNIKALQLEEDLNLPPHFNLPSLKLEDKK